MSTLSIALQSPRPQRQSRSRGIMLAIMAGTLFYVLYHTVQQHRDWQRRESWWQGRRRSANGQEVPVLELKPPKSPKSNSITGTLTRSAFNGYHQQVKVVGGQANAQMVVFQIEPTLKLPFWTQNEWYVLRKTNGASSTLYRLSQVPTTSATNAVHVPTNLDEQHERIAILTPDSPSGS